MRRTLTLVVDTEGTRLSSVLEEVIDVISGSRSLRGVVDEVRYTEEGPQAISRRAWMWRAE